MRSACSSRPPASRLRRWAVWVVLVVAAAVALAVGAQPGTARPSLAQRTRALASEVRCPVCVGETVADSSAPAAVTLRDDIHRELAAGEKPAAILAGIESVYGPGILEKPRATGIGLFLWLVPVLVALAAGGGLAAAFAWWGRQRRSDPASPGDHDLVAEFLRTAGAGTPRAAGEEGG